MQKRNFCMQVNIFLLCILLQSNVTFFITNDIIGMRIINQHKCENYLLGYSFDIMNSLDFIFILIPYLICCRLDLQSLFTILIFTISFAFLVALEGFSRASFYPVPPSIFTSSRRGTLQHPVFVVCPPLPGSLSY